jgi:hypothetical protein
MFNIDPGKITVDDNASVSSISDLDVKEIDMPIVHQESQGFCGENIESNSNSSPDRPFIVEPSISSIELPKLRRERKSDYGFFEQHFEDDVLNWFHRIDNKKRAELIHKLVDLMYYTKNPNMVNLYKDSPVKQDIKTTNPRYDYHDYSITLDDVEDLSLNDSSIIENKKNKED